MAGDTSTKADLARGWGRTAYEGFKASASFFATLPEDAWNDPTGCAQWDQQYLAGHIAGEVVWFPTVVRGVTLGDKPLPPEIYREMHTWSIPRIATRIEEAAEDLQSALDSADDAHFQQDVDMGFTTMPLWRAVYVSLMEGAYHNWDTRARREPNPTIPTPWAVQLASGLSFMAPMVAHRDALAAVRSCWVVEVGDGVGAVTIRARDGELTVQPGVDSSSDLTMRLDADAWVRLVAGRYDLVGPLERGELEARGDRARAALLTQIFGGIAN